MKTRCRSVLGAALALTLAACAGGAGSTTSTAGDVGGSVTSTQQTVVEDPTTTIVGGGTTTTATATTAVPNAVGVEDIDPDCLAAVASVLRTFEPVVEDVDWENATIEDHFQVMTDLASASFEDTTECNAVQLDVTSEQGAALFLAVAQEEAPGAVGYFTAILDINEALGGRASTGECSKDIALFEELVAGGVPWVDLRLPEQWYVLNLMGSIGFCSLQTQGELRFRPEVEAFLAGSPFAGG